MATPQENARTAAFRAGVQKIVNSGVTNIGPFWQKLFHARRAEGGAAMEKTEFDSLKGVVWNASGQDGTNGDHRWPIEYQIPTATTNRGELGTRSFQQFDPAVLAGIFYYSSEVTMGIAKRDLDLAANDDTRIFNLEVARAKGCQAALYTLFRKMLWNSTETGQCGGLTLVGTVANVAAETTYAGISMKAANTHWTPAHFQYTSYTIAANLMRILNGAAINLTRSSTSQGGADMAPDFCCFNPTSWQNVLTFFESKSTISNSGGLARPTMYSDKFKSIWMCGMDLFYDPWFAGSASGYLESAAAEEAIMGHSDKVFLLTTQAKNAGLVRVISQDETAEVRGRVAVYETGMQALKIESPIWFGTLYL